MNISIDLETLGTNNGDTILAIGACSFDIKTGQIISTFERNIRYKENKTIPCTLGTIKFWLDQAQRNPEAVISTFYPDTSHTLSESLLHLDEFINKYSDVQIWANGTKFDIAMLEKAYHDNELKVPWKYNSDRCLRTIKMLVGKLDIPTDNFINVPHTALSDAIWQAKYISKALKRINVEK